MRSERARRLGALAALLGALCAPGAAQPVQENDMKAAYVFNFAVFTEWPQEVLAGGAPISLCASAANPLFHALSQLNDKVVNGHRIAVRNTVTPVRGCHVLVLDKNDRERWAQLKRELAGAHVLTVSDDRSISADGAVIGLSVDERRIAFVVDMAAARSARLNLSSKLLRLARSVQ
ncbi:MAG: YfiR family protein [Pseudomonadota bacterium]